MVSLGGEQTSSKTSWGHSRPNLVRQQGVSSSNSLAIDFDKPNVIASYKRKEKEEKQMQAYCVKCRARKDMKDPRSITMKNGRPATQGICPTCGTKMFRIGKS